ncbi:MAG TPA: SDR family NAD(P)-dependent oxidoreductase [Limnochordia bacterium]
MPNAMPPQGPVVIVGVGPGLGASLARRFARGGLPVALVARGAERLERIAAEVRNAGGQALAVPGDAAVPAEVETAVRTVENAFGPIGTLIYNAGNFVRGRLPELSIEAFETAWRVGVHGAFLWARATVPGMIERGAGVILFTGATSSVMAPAHGPAFAAAKFGLRGLALSLARDLGPKGIHVAHVIVDGVIDTPQTRAVLTDARDEEFLSPAAIADAYWYLAAQPRSAWSFELDLRPHVDDYLKN